MADTPQKSSDLNIEDITQNVTTALSNIEWQTWGKAAIFILVGFMIAGFTSSVLGRVLSKYTSLHYTLIIRRIFYYGILAISVIFALTALQLDMKVLGIATVLTLAIGFASQTAVSNIISGLFLVFERPFMVGDHLEFNDIKGELISIDLLSIKLRTFDNSLIRVPNELLLKNQFTNLTNFPIRRLEIELRLSIHEEMDRVRKILFDLARKNPLALESPPQQMLFEEFTESAIVFKFAVWVKKEAYYTLKHSMPYDIQQALNEHNVKMPSMYVLPVKS